MGKEIALRKDGSSAGHFNDILDEFTNIAVICFVRACDGRSV